MDSVKGGINDWLSDIVLTVSPGSVEYVGVSKEDDLGGEGRLVRFQQPVGLDGLVNAIKKGLFLPASMCPTDAHTSIIAQFFRVPTVQLGRSAYPRSEKVTSVAICAGSGGSMLLGADADVYFTGEMSHVSLLACQSGTIQSYLATLKHEVLAAVASGRHVVLCGHTNTERGYLPKLAEKLREELKDSSFSGEGIEVHISTQDRHPLEIV